MDARPIGVFDSGAGGLSLLRVLRRQLPRESVLYYADTAHWPYGTRSAEEVRRLSVQATGWLIQHQAKLVVVACNSATTSAINHLRQVYPVPFVGVEPAVKPAAAATQTGKIAVLATTTTLSAPSYTRLLDRYAGDATVYSEAFPDLVAAVERGEVERTRLGPILAPVVGSLVEQGVDQIVLGCTHFPFAQDAIQEIAGPAVTVIDSTEAVARQVSRLLADRGLEAPADHQPRIQFACSGEREPFLRVVRQLVPELYGEAISSALALELGAALRES